MNTFYVTGIKVVIIIDTQEKMDKLLPESGEYSSLETTFPSESLEGVLFKGISFNKPVYFDFLMSISSFRVIILKDCSFIFEDSTDTRIIIISVSEKVVIDSCNFHNINFSIRSKSAHPKIFIENTIFDDEVTITSDNSGVTLIDIEVPMLSLGYNKNYPLFIYRSTIDRSAITRSKYSELDSNDVLIKESNIGSLFLLPYCTYIKDLNKGGSTFNSLFNNPGIKQLLLDCPVADCDLSGVSFSNAKFSGENRGFENCNLSNADLSKISIDIDSYTGSFYIELYECEGLDTLKIRKDMKIIQNTEESHVLVFKDSTDDNN